jgi:hypothetical protein
MPKYNYKIGDTIRMPKLQFEASELKINLFIITDMNDEVIFIKQDYYKNGKVVMTTHTGIFRKDL